MRRGGFSLLEVLVALTVMTVAILALLGLFPSVFNSDRKTMFSSIALYDAEAQLDALLRANSYIGTTAVIPTNGSPPLRMPNGTLSYIGSAFTYGTPQTITVTVTWVESGRIRHVSLQSQVFP